VIWATGQISSLQLRLVEVRYIHMAIRQQWGKMIQCRYSRSPAADERYPENFPYGTIPQPSMKSKARVIASITLSLLLGVSICLNVVLIKDGVALNGVLTEKGTSWSN
jgi:hypothetical protein